MCWIQGEPALVTIKVCNPYAFPLFVEAVGIASCVEDGDICDTPLEFNSSRGFELPPSLNGLTSIVSVELSVIPAVSGVISIKVQYSYHLLTFDGTNLPHRVSGPVVSTSSLCTALMHRGTVCQILSPFP